MSVTKKSVSLDDEVADRVARAAADEGVSFSAWLTEAARRQLILRDGLAAVAEYEESYGAFTDAERAEGRRILDDLLDRASPGITAS